MGSVYGRLHSVAFDNGILYVIRYPAGGIAGVW